jgi:hemerythrin-like domain-containing protein
VKAIEILVEEHKLILEGLDLLTAAAEKIVRAQNPPKEFFDKAVAFTFEFTNKFHQYKEDTVMMGLLAQKKQGEIDAEVERLRAQHGVLHDYMNDISNALDAYSKNVDSEVRRLHRNLSEYIDVCRRHVHAENRIFYPQVVRWLTQDEKNWLDEEFEKQAAKEGPDAMKAYSVFVEQMAKLL